MRRRARLILSMKSRGLLKAFGFSGIDAVLESTSQIIPGNYPAFSARLARDRLTLRVCQSGSVSDTTHKRCKNDNSKMSGLSCMAWFPFSYWI